MNSIVVEELRARIERASREHMPGIAAALWKAYDAKQVNDADVHALHAVIEARSAALIAVPDAPAAPRRIGTRPRTNASMERRRRWVASGKMPPRIAAYFTMAEAAVLALVAAETTRRKDCRLSVGQLAAVAGVSETTVRNALREARRLGLVTIEERRRTTWRNDTNVVRIISAEWQAWLARVPRGGGCKSANPTNTILREQASSHVTGVHSIATGLENGVPGARFKRRHGDFG